MPDVDDLSKALGRIDGKGYKAYRDIRGEWTFPTFTLIVDHVQGDPYAAPSRVRVRVPAEVTALPEDVCRRGPRGVGTACLLARRFAREAHRRSRPRGTGRSGEVRIEAPGQEVVPNTAVLISPDGGVEARFTVGLPARGRTALGREARTLLLEDVPAIVDGSLLARSHDEADLRLHANVNEDADALRNALSSLGLVAFVSDGSVLPRRSGVDDRPLEGGKVVRFESPKSLRSEVTLPHAGRITGMAVEEGITLVVGGGYHGKSTLLRSIERGVYNHRPGDGREQVVTRSDAVKIRAEDGRSVTGVDISPFIGELPGGVGTRAFSTPNASGSTSQAAAIVEAMEAGTGVLLIDEDTSATNFMIRDRRMQALIPREREPITPFIDRVRELYDGHGISSILVLGGSGDYFDVADRVVAMTNYVPEDVTDRARAVVRSYPTGRIAEAPEPLEEPPPRRPVKASVDPRRGRRDVKIQVRGLDEIRFGTSEIDLSAVDQLVSWAQIHAVSEALLLARERFMDGKRSVPQILDEVMSLLETEGLDVLGWGTSGDLALFRRHELAAALNRIRELEVR